MLRYFNGMKHPQGKQIDFPTQLLHKILHGVAVALLSVGLLACGEEKKTTISGTVSTNLATQGVAVQLTNNKGWPLAQGCKTDPMGRFSCQIRRLDATPKMRLQSEGTDPMDSLIVKQKIPTEQITRHINPITNFIAKPTYTDGYNRETSAYRSGREDALALSEGSEHRTSQGGIRILEPKQVTYEQKVQNVSNGLGVKAQVFINDPQFQPRIPENLDSGSVAANLLEAIGKKEQNKADAKYPNQGSKVNLNAIIGNVLEKATQTEEPVVTQPEILVRLAALSLSRNQAKPTQVAESFSQMVTAKTAPATTSVFLGVVQAFEKVKQTADEKVKATTDIPPNQQNQLVSVALEGMENALVVSLENKTANLETPQLNNLAQNMADLLKDPVAQAIVEANDEFQGYDLPLEAVKTVVVSAATKAAKEVKDNDMDLIQTTDPSQAKTIFEEAFAQSKTNVQTQIKSNGPQISQEGLKEIAKKENPTLTDHNHAVCPFNRSNGQTVVVRDSNGNDLYPSQLQIIDCANEAGKHPSLAGTLLVNTYKKAKALDLSHNQLTAIGGLNRLTQLTSLNLQNNHLKDIGRLNGLKQLAELNLQANSLTTIGTLSGLTQLTTLKLGNNAILCQSLGTPPTGKANLFKNSGCQTAYNTAFCPFNADGSTKTLQQPNGQPLLPSQITNIQCEGNQIAGTLSVGAYVNATTLDLSDNNLTSLNGLSGLTQLTVLDLGFNNNLTNIGDLSGLTQLTALNLANIGLTDINLSGLTQLTHLNLSENLLAGILNVSDLRNLTYLDLSNNNLTNIGDLSGLANLTTLDLSDNPLSNIGDLSGLNHLSSLSFGGSGIPCDSVPSRFAGQCPSQPTTQSKPQPKPTVATTSTANPKPTVATTPTVAKPQPAVATTSTANPKPTVATTSTANPKPAVATTSTGTVATQFATTAYGGPVCPFESNGSPKPVTNASGQTLRDAQITNIVCQGSRGNKISGTVSVGAYVNATTLNVVQNNLTNIVGLSGLTKLTQLYLSQNNLTDLNLSGLRNLTYLDLQSNQLTDLNLSGLTNLTELHLQNNQLTDLNLSGLTNLTTLNLQNNQLTNIVGLSGLTKLTQLHLSQNNLAGTFNVSGFANLTQLDLRKNSSLTNIGDLSGQANLGALLLGDTKIFCNSLGTPPASDPTLFKRSGCRKLHTAPMCPFNTNGSPNLIPAQITNIVCDGNSGNKISGTVSVGAFVNATTLDLQSNQLTNIVGLSGLTSLTKLNLYNNQLTNIVGLSGLTNLTQLGLELNRFLTNIGDLSGLTNLSTLNLNNTNVSCNSLGTPPTSNPNLFRNSGCLNLHTAPVCPFETDGSPKIVRANGQPLLPAQITNIVCNSNALSTDMLGTVSVGDYVNATTLNLNDNRITGLDSLSGLTNLTTLKMKNNQLAGTLNVSGLTNLTELNLSRNFNLTGLDGLSDLTSLTTLIVREANMAGTLNVSRLTNLTTLNLYNNEYLTGLDGLSGLKKLTTLEVGINKLAGTFDVSGLNNLTELNLSGNNQLTHIGDLSQLKKLNKLNLNNTNVSCNSLGTPLASKRNLFKTSGCLNLHTAPVCPFDESGDPQTVQANGQPLLPAEITNIVCNNFFYTYTKTVSVGDYVNATTLNLNDNSLTGLDGLSGLTNLTSLKVRENELVGTFNVSGLTNLTELNLYNNSVIGLDGLSGLTNLTTLNLEDNNLAGTLNVSGLTNLTALNVRRNPLVTLNVSGLTNLTTLNLYENHSLTGLDGLSDLTNLTTLIVGHSELAGTLNVSGLNNLTHLNLYANNQLTNIGNLSGLINLTYLNLGQNQLTDIGNLSRLTRLETLKLGGGSNAIPCSSLGTAPTGKAALFQRSGCQ